MVPSLNTHQTPSPPPPSASSLSSCMADTGNNKLLHELDALSQSMYQAHTARRTASLTLPRSSDADHSLPAASDAYPRSRRKSMSPFLSRRQPDTTDLAPTATNPLPPSAYAAPIETEKKGIWGWKPLRALTHIGMNRLSILLSVEVEAIQSLPASMNGLRLFVTVRRKETKEGAVQTMPARVLQGAADFEETLFIRSHVYCSGGGSTGKPLRFEPRPFLISAKAIDAPELYFGQSSVDLSLLVKESMERSLEGSRIRQWDMAFKLLGKAKGGELVLKLGFQIMEDGVGIYNQVTEVAAGSSGKGTGTSSSSFARRQSKSSFSISSPKAARSKPSMTPSRGSNAALELKGIEEFNLDGDSAPPSPNPQPKNDDLDLLEFEVIDKGIEASLDGEADEEAASDQVTDEASAAREVVKEVVHDSVHNARLTELDFIAKQIKALESVMINDGGTLPVAETQQLDAEEETVTMEFLQMLELEGKYRLQELKAKEDHNFDEKSYLSDLANGLGSVVQTRDGGYLASMNPLDIEVPRREAPKLVMQISKPIIIGDSKSLSGFEVFQRLAAKGLEELGLKLMSLTSMDELMGKTAEQIAFEGIASAIVSGRKKEEVAASAAEKSVAVLKSMAAAMNEGRKERIVTGIWNAKEEPLASVEELLPFSLQKMEAMSVDGLKVQAGAAEEAPFDVSPAMEGGSWLLESAMPVGEWGRRGIDGVERVILVVLIQLRDPLRRYEAVGGSMVAMVQAARVGGGAGLKVGSLHVGGMRLRSGRKRSVWDGERQRLTAMQWLVAHGMGKGGRRRNVGEEKGGKEAIWSLSSRVMADMWLKPTRNPDVRVIES